MLSEAESTPEGVTTLTVRDHSDYQSLKIIASTNALKALEKYAEKKLYSLSAKEGEAILPFPLVRRERKARTAAYMATQAKEFFETTKLPYMIQEIANDRSIKRTYGFDQKGQYQSPQIDMPVKDKVRSFFKAMGVGSIKASFGFQKALSEEMDKDVMYEWELRRALDKNEVTCHPDNVLTKRMSLSVFSDSIDQTQSFLKKHGIEPDKERQGVDRDGPSI